MTNFVKSTGKGAKPKPAPKPNSAARFDLDGLPVEIYSTGTEGEGYAVTEPDTHPVGYLFRRVRGVEFGCVCIDEYLTVGQVERMELLEPKEKPTLHNDLGRTLWAMMIGLASAAEAGGRENEAYSF